MGVKKSQVPILIPSSELGADVIPPIICTFKCDGAFHSWMCDPVTCASMASFLETCKPCAPKESSKRDPEIQRKQKNLEDMKQFAQSLTPKDLMTQNKNFFVGI